MKAKKIFKPKKFSNPQKNSRTQTKIDLIKFFSNFEIIILDGELLIEAVQSGKIDQVEFLLSIKSLDVNYRRVATGQTALMYCKCPHIAKLLLKQGAGECSIYINHSILISFFKFRGYLSAHMILYL